MTIVLTRTLQSVGSGYLVYSELSAVRLRKLGSKRSPERRSRGERPLSVTSAEQSIVHTASQLHDTALWPSPVAVRTPQSGTELIKSRSLKAHPLPHSVRGARRF
jgi:hypothetical protein